MFLPVYNARRFINDILNLKTDLIYNFCEMVELESQEEVFAAGLFELVKSTIYRCLTDDTWAVP
jgi:hypothetical protein